MKHTNKPATLSRKLSNPEEASSSKSDCQDIINNNIFPGRRTIREYTSGRWAMINARGTCLLSVARLDDSTNPFVGGDQDIKGSVAAAMGLCSDTNKMRSAGATAVCDARDTTGNDVSVKWWVADPEDVPGTRPMSSSISMVDSRLFAQYAILVVLLAGAYLITSLHDILKVRP
ncbi:hypothetical protein VPNG_07610 [Cytospora leucostoma]|uniref:Ecp2 effector protein domain-containing protein n=1 Tax=Cytospora leucostoma TaxID=1230097 RepID=A0A423WDC6_9PEZI|nr:hypothetical protein VPNG_07610 [Cytospora leucostoma]